MSDTGPTEDRLRHSDDHVELSDRSTDAIVMSPHIVDPAPMGDDAAATLLSPEPPSAASAEGSADA